MPKSDGGVEWYLLKDQADLEQFRSGKSKQIIFAPVSYPVLATYGYDSDCTLIAIYVYPEDLRTMLGYLKNLAPAAFAELAKKVREIAG